jgi:hypothetical protein
MRYQTINVCRLANVCLLTGYRAVSAQSRERGLDLLRAYSAEVHLGALLQEALRSSFTYPAASPADQNAPAG